MKPNSHLLLYASNIPVSGKDGAAIYALEQGTVYQIPNVFVDLIHEWENDTFENVSKNYADQADILEQYVNFIISEDLGFFTDTPEFFPRLEITFEKGEAIGSAIVAYNGGYSFTNVIEALNKLNCKYLELIIDLNFNTFAELESFLRPVLRTTIREIRLLVTYPDHVSEDLLDELVRQNQKLATITFCQAGFVGKTEKDFCKIDFLPISITDLVEKNNQHNSFIANRPFFMESNFFNTLYYKKVCIDYHGNIKNDLKQKKNFGNVKKDALGEIVNHDDFQTLWFKSPDQISWMKDSELRYCIFNPLKKDFSSQEIKKRLVIR